MTKLKLLVDDGLRMSFCSTDVHLLALGNFQSRLSYITYYLRIFRFNVSTFGFTLDIRSFTLLTTDITLRLTTNLTLNAADKPWTVPAIFAFDIQMAGNSETEDPVQQEAVDYQSCDDTLLTIRWL